MPIKGPKVDQLFGVRPIVGETWKYIGEPENENIFRFYKHITSKKTVVVLAAKMTCGWSVEMLNSAAVGFIQFQT